MLRLALEKPTIVTAAMLILCLFGLSAVLRVPIQMIPDVDPRIVTVTTQWPGATPQDVEQEILIEQEEFLRGINGLVRMESAAYFGRATVQLEFPVGMDINDALIRVTNALSQMSNYPENVDDPSITASSASEAAFAFFRIVPLEGNPKGLEITDQLDWVEDNVKRRIERVPGVSRVGVSGVPARQVNVYLDPDSLAARGLTLMQVREALRSRNRDVSGGDLDFGKRRYLVRTVGRFDSIEAMNDLIITEREGAFIRLRDVGYAELGKQEVRSLSFTGSDRSLALSVNKQSGANVVEVLDG
ncbi:MAG: efflux RND transporter permease subunit, partial [Pseudomonadota bacterium]